MLNCWCITWPVGFRRLKHRHKSVNLFSKMSCFWLWLKDYFQKYVINRVLFFFTTGIMCLQYTLSQFSNLSSYCLSSQNSKQILKMLHIWISTPTDTCDYGWPQGVCEWLDSRKNVLVKFLLFSIRADHIRVFLFPHTKIYRTEVEWRWRQYLEKQVSAGIYWVRTCFLVLIWRRSWIVPKNFK
jgi:hypothetical protein